MNLLEVERLRVAYGHVVAVDDVSLHVGEGETVAIIGGNGAGKSSIVRAVMGMLRPAGGTIRGPGGAPLDRMPPHRICHTGIALVPSERQVFGEMSVRENLEMGAYARRDLEIDDDMEAVLGRFPALRPRLGHLAGNLSGGQQQQLAIGRALMARPRLLLMDEPSLGLSPSLVGELFALIGSLQISGLATLLVEQNARRALAVSARAYVLRAGSLVAQGRSSDLLVDPLVARAYLGLRADARKHADRRDARV